MAGKPDPIVLELFKNAIFSIADDMALTVFRTTYSAVLKDNMDYSTGFADGDGKLAAQGLTLPGHLGSIPTAMESIMRHFREDMVPGACAARGLTGFRMVDCMFGALAMMLPERVKAAGDGGNTGITIGGWTAERKPFVYVDFTCGAWGARPWADGLDGNSHMFANMASQPVEVTEAEHPIQLLAYEFVPDKAGAGNFRGGVPFKRDYRLLEAEAILQVRSDRRTHRPFGLYGGSPGQPSENYLNPDTENRELPSKVTMTIRRGDVFRHVLAGAGGWGDPLERYPELVLRDV